MGLFQNYVRQTKKPEGFLGKIMIKGMNSGHARMADWGMAHLQGIAPAEIIDIGCGGGRNAGELLRRYPNAKVTAIDYSPLSVEQAEAYNRSAASAGRCIVQQGDVSALAFGSENYDLATAFETIYFWPGLTDCFSEVARVLKPGGRFLIVNESDGADSAGQIFEKMIDGMKPYTANEIKAALKAAGFSEITAEHHERKPWIVVLAKK